MILFALIFGSTATWPWIVDLSIYGLLTLSFIATRFYMIIGEEDDSPIGIWAMYSAASFISTAPALFCCYYLFCGWTPSPWWFFMSLLIGLVISYIPAGHSIITLILLNSGAVTSVPVWLWVVIILLDFINILSFILSAVKQSRMKMRSRW